MVAEKIREEHISLNTAVAGWKILQPIPLVVEGQGNLYVVSDDVFFIYGVGHSIHKAKEDYLRHLVGYYHLMAGQAIADVHTHRLFQRLQYYIGPEAQHEMYS